MLKHATGVCSGSEQETALFSLTPMLPNLGLLSPFILLCMPLSATAEVAVDVVGICQVCFSHVWKSNCVMPSSKVEFCLRRF